MDWTSFFAQFMPPQRNKPWIPTYLPQQYVSEPDNQGEMAKQPLNITYFPDSASCQVLLDKYCPQGSIFHQDLLGGGPDTVTTRIPYVLFPNGVAIMAGMLTVLWTNNPGHQDVADSLCLAAIAVRGAK